MTKTDLKGLVIYMNDMKDLIQTKKIKICQRENLSDKMFFLIPLTYNYEDMEKYIVLLVYQCPDKTARSVKLSRLSNGQGGYENYEDVNGNETHMIYHLDVSSDITTLAGDVTLSLSMQYTDYEGQTSSDSDDQESPEPGDGTVHVINTEETIVHIMPIKDYYAVLDDERLSVLNRDIARLEAAQEQLNNTAAVYDRDKADSLELHVDPYNQCIRLTSHGKPIGEEIDLNRLGTEISDWNEEGLVRVITDEDAPEPGPIPTDEYADNIVLVVDESTKAIYLTHKGHKIGTPIYLEDLGIAVSDADSQGLIKVITDDDNSITVITDDD